MIQLKEAYDLEEMLKAIAVDVKHQRKDRRQQKNIDQDVITELMIENIRNRQKQHD
jgi:hypothetical protein